MEMSYHCKVQRSNRLEHMVKEIGLGQVVREKYMRSVEQAVKGEAGHYICITDTGITLIKSDDKATIITMYVTTYGELLMVYGSQKAIPSYLRKKVDHNQSKYVKNGKTIWR